MVPPHRTLLLSAAQAQKFEGMSVHLVWCDTTYFRGHATNLTASRSFFKGVEPILVVMADHLYEDLLLGRLTSTVCCGGDRTHHKRGRLMAPPDHAHPTLL